MQGYYIQVKKNSIFSVQFFISAINYFWFVLTFYDFPLWNADIYRKINKENQTSNLVFGNIYVYILLSGLPFTSLFHSNRDSGGGPSTGSSPCRPTGLLWARHADLSSPLIHCGSRTTGTDELIQTWFLCEDLQGGP